MISYEQFVLAVMRALTDLLTFDANERTVKLVFMLILCDLVVFSIFLRKFARRIDT